MRKTRKTNTPQLALSVPAKFQEYDFTLCALIIQNVLQGAKISHSRWGTVRVVEERSCDDRVCHIKAFHKHPKYLEGIVIQLGSDVRRYWFTWEIKPGNKPERAKELNRRIDEAVGAVLESMHDVCATACVTRPEKQASDTVSEAQAPDGTAEVADAGLAKAAKPGEVRTAYENYVLYLLQHFGEYGILPFSELLHRFRRRFPSVTLPEGIKDEYGDVHYSFLVSVVFDSLYLSDDIRSLEDIDGVDYIQMVYHRWPIGVSAFEWELAQEILYTVGAFGIPGTVPIQHLRNRFPDHSPQEVDSAIGRLAERRIICKTGVNKYTVKADYVSIVTAGGVAQVSLMPKRNQTAEERENEVVEAANVVRRKEEHIRDLNRMVDELKQEIAEALKDPEVRREVNALRLRSYRT